MEKTRVSLRAKKPKLEGYVVYQVMYKDELLYIGEGKQGRQLHATSGTSHMYELNRLHFTDPDNIRVDVIKEFDNKRDAEIYEIHLIQTLNPKLNVKRVVTKTTMSISVPTTWCRLARSHFDRLHDHIFCYYTVAECFGGIPVSKKLPHYNAEGIYLYLKSNTMAERQKAGSLFKAAMNKRVIEWFHEDGITYIKLHSDILKLSVCNNPVKATVAKHTGLPINQL